MGTVNRRVGGAAVRNDRTVKPRHLDLRLLPPVAGTLHRGPQAPGAQVAAPEASWLPGCPRSFAPRRPVLKSAGVFFVLIRILKNVGRLSFMQPSDMSV